MALNYYFYSFTLNWFLIFLFLVSTEPFPLNVVINLFIYAISLNNPTVALTSAKIEDHHNDLLI